MEPWDPIWTIGVVAFVGGGAIGIILYRLIAPAAKNVEKLRARAEQADRELAEYKTKVTDHFNATSDLVNDLTRDYVKVYKHLAEGAHELGDPERASKLLDHPQNQGLVSFADEEKIDPASQQLISQAVQEAARAVRESSGEASAPKQEASPSADAGRTSESEAREEAGDKTATSGEEPGKPAEK